tara:strand:+ start:572 stop:853 length:282 start_codon:yes stop_codon:yes gene_type:complete
MRRIENGKDSTAAEEFMKRGRIDYIDEQDLDIIRGDTHKILSGVYRNLKNLGCEDLPEVEEQFQIIENRVVNLTEQVKSLQRKISEKVNPANA